MFQKIAIAIFSVNFILIPNSAEAAIRVFITSIAATTWTVPSDWSNLNTIEVIGGGASGNDGNGDGGGVGGDAINGQAGNPGEDTYFHRTAGTAGTCADTVLVCAKGGGGGGSETGGGAGGSAASSVGTTTYSGGTGGNGAANDGSGGGGGAAGPYGTGKDGGTSS